MTEDANQRELLHGIVEADETYIGGKPRKGNRRDDDKEGGNKKKRGRGTDKMPVIGVMERGGFEGFFERGGLGGWALAHKALLTG